MSESSNLPCKRCKGLTLHLDTRDGDPEGIRNDIQCAICGTKHAVTKGGYYIIHEHHAELTTLRQRVAELERELENRHSSMTWHYCEGTIRTYSAVCCSRVRGTHDLGVDFNVLAELTRLTAERDEARKLLNKAMSRLNNWCNESKADHCPCEDCTLWREIKQALTRHSEQKGGDAP